MRERFFKADWFSRPRTIEDTENFYLASGRGKINETGTTTFGTECWRRERRPCSCGSSTC